MGVKGIIPFLRRTVPGCLTEQHISAYRSKALAIDGNLFLMKFLRSEAIMRPFSDDTDLANPNPEAQLLVDQRHLYGFFQLVRSLQRYNITPLVIFDDHRRPTEKKKEGEKRAAALKELETRIEDETFRTKVTKALQHIGDCIAGQSIELLKRHHTKLMRAKPMKAIRLTKPENLTRKTTANQLCLQLKRIHSYILYEEAMVRQKSTSASKMRRQIVKLQRSLYQSIVYQDMDQISPQTVDHAQTMVIPSILPSKKPPTTKPDKEKTAESEALCAALCDATITAGTLSEDTDVLLLGSGPLLRNYQPSSGRLNSVDPRAVRTELGFTDRQFIDFCILCGTDFCSSINKVGPITAHQLIVEYGDIETILEKCPHLVPRDDFTYKSARKMLQPSTASIPSLFLQSTRFTRRESRQLPQYLARHNLVYTPMEVVDETKDSAGGDTLFEFANEVNTDTAQVQSALAELDAVSSPSGLSFPGLALDQEPMANINETAV
ncbi:PIN domain-like protein [Dimargaris cristalligena]|uniref:PIN domain-like protein n=1 Tax=Dimargaris cristalligena TaxID=215637 RepID=A0A4V1J4L8_9FUNG|nr:PIN domain-like protein [Dimargaris cristalligena]|eukprot:RKP36009.1 PIN domain-like protein [Dimargaris cristalligena]